MKYYILIALLAVLIVLIPVVIGLILPKEHVVQRRKTLPITCAQLWELITDHSNEPKWRSNVISVEQVSSKLENPIWCESYRKGGQLKLRTLKHIPGKLLVREIVDEPSFGGTWTFELITLDDSTCKLTITERGEIYNPIFRFVGRFILGHDRTINGYMDAVVRACNSPTK